MTYELVDLDSASLVGTYPNQDIALLVVLETANQSGEEAASTLSLGVPDPTGQTDGHLVAQGYGLLDLARQRYGSPIAAPAPTFA